MTLNFSPQLTDQDYAAKFEKYFDHIIATLELTYGGRDMKYRLVGIRFHDKVPEIYYPIKGETDIEIRLKNNARDDIETAVYQLAHECVHYLGPSGGQHANVLEEGFATWFSTDYVRRTLGWGFGTGNIRYDKAVDAFEKLMAIDRGAVQKLRAQTPNLSLVNTEMFSAVGHAKEVPKELIDELLTPFADYHKGLTGQARPPAGKLW